MAGVAHWCLELANSSSDRTLLDLRCCLNGGSSNERSRGSIVTVGLARDFERSSNDRDLESTKTKRSHTGKRSMAARRPSNLIASLQTVILSGSKSRVTCAGANFGAGSLLRHRRGYRRRSWARPDGTVTASATAAVTHMWFHIIGLSPGWTEPNFVLRKVTASRVVGSIEI